jgi:hypothetical protein
MSRLIKLGSPWEWCPPILVLPLFACVLVLYFISPLIPLRLLRRWGMYD